MANIRVKDLPNTNTAADTDEFIIDSSTAGTRRLSYSELKSEISTDFAADVATYGIATLDSDNKLTASQIPDSLAQGMNFVGVANSASDLTSTTQGDFYVIQTAFGSYNVGDQAVYDGSAYVRVVDGTKEISEGGTGATTLDAAKTSLEIINVGTGPSQVPLNQHLGTMAYQDIAGVSAAKIEVESTTGTATTQALTVTDGTDTNFVVQEDGKTGIGTASPSSYYSASDDLVIAGASNRGISIIAGATSSSSIAFGSGTGTDAYRGKITYDNNSHSLSFNTLSATRATIDSSGRLGLGINSPNYLFQAEGAYFSAGFPFNVAVQNNTTAYNVTDNGSGIVFGGRTAASGGLITSLAGVAGCKANNTDGNHEGNLRVLVRENGASSMTESARFTKDGLVMGSGMAIDFGSGATLDDYEEGDWTPVFAPQIGSFTTMTMNVPNARYTKIGNMVHIQAYIRTDAVNLAGGTGSIYITGLPFTATGSYTSLNVGYALDWTNNPAGAYVQSGSSYLVFTKRSTSITGSLIEAVVGDLNSSAGVRNYVMIDGAYETAS